MPIAKQIRDDLEAERRANWRFGLIMLLVALGLVAVLRLQFISVSPEAKVGCTTSTLTLVSKP